MFAIYGFVLIVIRPGSNELESCIRVEWPVLFNSHALGQTSMRVLWVWKLSDQIWMGVLFDSHACDQTKMRVNDSWQEPLTDKRVKPSSTLIEIFRHIQSWWERSRDDESAWGQTIARVWTPINSHRNFEPIQVKVHDSAGESMRVHECWRWKESIKSLSSHQLLSTPFARLTCETFVENWNMFKVDESVRESMRVLERVGGQRRVRIWTLIDSHRNFEQVRSWWGRWRVDESAWELVIKGEYKEFELSFRFSSKMTHFNFKIDIF